VFEASPPTHLHNPPSSPPPYKNQQRRRRKGVFRARHHPVDGHRRLLRAAQLPDLRRVLERVARGGRVVYLRGADDGRAGRVPGGEPFAFWEGGVVCASPFFSFSSVLSRPPPSSKRKQNHENTKTNNKTKQQVTTLIFEYVLANAAVARTFSAYFAQLISPKDGPTVVLTLEWGSLTVRETGREIETGNALPFIPLVLGRPTFPDSAADVGGVRRALDPLALSPPAKTHYLCRRDAPTKTRFFVPLATQNQKKKKKG